MTNDTVLAALVLPALLTKTSDRTVILAGAALATFTTFLAAMLNAFVWLIPLWFVLGIGYSAAQTPSGRLLRRSAHAEERPALFSAQFALTHACWLITYPFAGWIGASYGLPVTAIGLALLATVATIGAFVLWPSKKLSSISHSHDDLPPDHPHLAGAGQVHSHDYVIDELHPVWPKEP